MPVFLEILALNPDIKLDPVHLSETGQRRFE